MAPFVALCTETQSFWSFDNIDRARAQTARRGTSVGGTGDDARDVNRKTSRELTARCHLCPGSVRLSSRLSPFAYFQFPRSHPPPAGSDAYAVIAAARRECAADIMTRGWPVRGRVSSRGATIRPDGGDDDDAVAATSTAAAAR